MIPVFLALGLIGASGLVAAIYGVLIAHVTRRRPHAAPRV